MKFGVCPLNLVPLRAEASHKSEMVSQLLFAETFKILNYTNEWLFIETDYDQYTGWVVNNQVMLLNEANYVNIVQNVHHHSTEIVSTAKALYKESPVLMGSALPFYNQKQFSFFDDKYRFDGNTVDIYTMVPTEDSIKDIALKYMNAPYLWGGKTPLGVDCSGFTQMVFKLNGIKIPRDSSQQAQNGILIDNIRDAQTGDLAFFNNENNQIIHVGLLLNNNQIIHAHGKVRIDSINTDGIYNNDISKITHTLSHIKRFFNTFTPKSDDQLQKEKTF